MFFFIFRNILENKKFCKKSENCIKPVFSLFIMSKKKNSRRSFIKQNSIIGLGAALGVGMPSLPCLQMVFQASTYQLY